MATHPLKITAPFALIFPKYPLAGGRDNPLWPMVQTLNGFVDNDPAGSRGQVGDNYVWEAHLNTSVFNWDAIETYVLPVGGEVEGFPAWFEVRDMSREVPADLPAADITDDEGEAVTGRRTWEQWATQHGDVRHVVRDNRNFVKSSAGTMAWMLATLISTISADANVVGVLTSSDLPPAKDAE